MAVEQQDPLLLKIPAAANLLSLSRASIYALIADGSLEVVRFGRAARITTESIRSWVAKQRA